MNKHNLDQENAIFFYICHNNHLISKVDHEFFNNQYLSKLFALTKSYFQRYADLPFIIDSNNIDQIKIIVEKQPEKFQINNDMDKDENVEAFLNNTKNILSTEYSSYEPKWLKKLAEGWIKWRATEIAFQGAIDFMKTSKIDEHNVDQVINTAKNIINQGAGLVVEDKISKDFMDAESHKQIEPENLINSGWQLLNKWLSGNVSGGFEPGTLNIFIGESNIGKSIWLGNLAYNIFLNGKNVLLISLEMSVEKIFKRIGSNAFDININEYSQFSANEAYVNEKIKEFRAKHSSSLIPVGNLRSEKFTSATAKDIQAFARAESKRLGIKWHAIVIDYMTELDNSYGINQADMYMFHKTNNSDLYNMAGEEDVAVITAHQIKGDDFGRDDLTISSLGESKGIVHRTDNIFGIIQTPSMKLEQRYHLKNIKSRDGAYKNYKIGYEINYNRMNIREMAEMMEPGETIFGGS